MHWVSLLPLCRLCIFIHANTAWSLKEVTLCWTLERQQLSEGGGRVLKCDGWRWWWCSNLALIWHFYITRTFFFSFLFYCDSLAIQLFASHWLGSITFLSNSIPLISYNIKTSNDLLLNKKVRHPAVFSGRLINIYSLYLQPENEMQHNAWHVNYMYLTRSVNSCSVL